jgi:hypothetical protein
MEVIDTSKKTTAYVKVWKTIRTASHIHFENGSLLNLINNFNNMYNDKAGYDELMFDYQNKLKNLNE